MRTDSLFPDTTRVRSFREGLEGKTVLVLPKIDLADSEQLALTDALGQRVSIAAQIPGYDRAAPIFQVTLNKGARIEPEYIHGTYFWHMDGVTVNLPPPKATLLSARRISRSEEHTAEPQSLMRTSYAVFSS